MATVRVDEYGSFSQALRAFRIKCQQSGLTAEIKKHMEYEKPGEKRRKKRLKAIRRERRRLYKIQQKLRGL